MTAQEAKASVLARYPVARSVFIPPSQEWHIYPNLGSWVHVGEGDTEPEAWIAAARGIDGEKQS